MRFSVKDGGEIKNKRPKNKVADDEKSISPGLNKLLSLQSMLAFGLKTVRRARSHIISS